MLVPQFGPKLLENRNEKTKDDLERIKNLKKLIENKKKFIKSTKKNVKKMQYIKRDAIKKNSCCIDYYSTSNGGYWRIAILCYKRNYELICL